MEIKNYLFYFYCIISSLFCFILFSSLTLKIFIWNEQEIYQYIHTNKRRRRKKGIAIIVIIIPDNLKYGMRSKKINKRNGEREKNSNMIVIIIIKKIEEEKRNDLYYIYVETNIVYK